MRFFAPITKVDAAQRMVWGYASTEAVDSQGETITRAAIAGATLFWQGIVRHVIVTMTLTAAQRLQMEGWLAWDSGLTGILPASHPFKSVRP